MKYLILYSSLYGSTKQIGKWIKERLELDKNEVIYKNVKNFEAYTNCETLVLLSPIYSGKGTKEFYNFLDKNFERLTFQKLVIIAVAMQKKDCFDENQNLRFLDNYKNIRNKASLQKVLLGEIIYSKLNNEYQEKLSKFYKSINLDKTQIKNMLRPRTLLNKKDVWSLAQKI